LEITTEMIKEFRSKCGAGVMECRAVLIESGGDYDKATKLLKERGLLQAEKKADRVTMQGLVESYIHFGGRVGAMVELNCETDFVARTDEFKELAHNLAMQIAAQQPRFIAPDEVPETANLNHEEVCLLAQPYIKDPTRTIRDIVTEVIAKTGENIRISRFARFELGVKDSGCKI
jgi:elongation factor Ts